MLPFGFVLPRGAFGPTLLVALLVAGRGFAQDSPPGARAPQANEGSPTEAQLEEHAPAAATPQGPVNIEFLVDRSETAGDCPDRAELQARVLLHAGGAVQPPVVQHITVEFSHSADEYRAELVFAGWRQGRRSIAAAGPNCEGVAQAAAVAISILLDPSVSPEPGTEAPVEANVASPTEPSPSETPAATKPTEPEKEIGERAVVQPELDRSPEPPDSPPSTKHLWLMMAPGLTYGFNGSLGYAVEAGPALLWQRSALELLGFVAPPKTTSDSAGSASILLVGAHVRGCLARGESRRNAMNVSACLQLSGGALRGRARGYDTVEAATYFPWLAVGPAVQVFRHGAHSGWSASAALPLPMTRYSYVITRESGGVYRRVYHTPSWTAWLGISLDLLIL